MKTTNNGIEWTADAFGNTTLARGNRAATVSPCSGEWIIVATASGCTLRAFSGKTYTTLRGAFKAAEKWLAREC
jgi:hypothetical protein